MCRLMLLAHCLACFLFSHMQVMCFLSSSEDDMPLQFDVGSSIHTSANSGRHLRDSIHPKLPLLVPMTRLKRGK
ncbi:hypothetical protein DER45DRAFT_577631 [Fusarium avenaceum]|nr:hypothetical protein DER45DRAFT_577631 [Fusarium avenaceum]